MVKLFFPSQGEHRIKNGVIHAITHDAVWLRVKSLQRKCSEITIPVGNYTSINESKKLYNILLIITKQKDLLWIVLAFKSKGLCFLRSYIQRHIKSFQVCTQTTCHLVKSLKYFEFKYQNIFYLPKVLVFLNNVLILLWFN